VKHEAGSRFAAKLLGGEALFSDVADRVLRRLSSFLITDRRGRNLADSHE
jgi:hypothetical protein